ncbi:MAG: cytochrome c oxidase subunit I [Actinobacteria bacterium]|nr:cytochrome c oxidase subunit I [Actinomycetota bacterium]
MSEVVQPPVTTPPGEAPHGATGVDHASAAGGGIGAWLTTTDHKRIGLMYIGTALAFFVVAVVFAVLMRTQLIQPRMDFLAPDTYNQIFSMHGTTMIFLFGMPILIGVANYILPLQIGARDMAFPRANALSYWLLLFGGLMLYSSFLFGGALDTGWFSYTPLSLEAFSPHDGVTFWTVSLAILGASSVLGSINFIVTCLRFRAPGMSIWQMPLFSVATYINSYLILFAIPSLTAAIALLYSDRQFGTSFFNPAGGGDPIIWQHLFWFFGHPEVYILILPAFGVMSEVVPVFSRKPLFGRASMVVMLGVIGFLGFTVWAHHMFATGLPTLFNTIMAATSMLIAIPTGVKIFNWLATMWGGALRFTTSMMFACGLIALFVVGGVTGVTLAVVPWDWQVTDTYYVVAHFHNTLIPGTVFAMFAGIYYWFPKMTGRFLSERIGKIQFWLMTIGFLLTFFPLYVVGILGMPRRVYTYDANVGWTDLNTLSSIGGYILATGFLLLFVNIFVSLRSGKVAGDDPWRGWTLEWATTSPPPHDNFTRLPEIRSDRPLYDAEHGWEDEGGRVEKIEWHSLPPQAEQRTIAPFWLAVGMLVLGIGMLGAPLVFIVGFALILITVAVWMTMPWTQIAPTPPAPGRELRFSFIGLGTLFFIGSEAVFFASLIAGAIHLRIHNSLFGGGSGVGLELPLINTVVLVVSGVTAHYAQTAYRARRKGRFFFLLVLTIILGVVFLGGQAWEYTHAGFGFADTIITSSFYVLTGFHGFHVACGIAALVYLVFRARRDLRRAPGERRLPEPTPGTSGLVDGGTYYWHFVDAVWVVVFITVYLL